MSKLKPKLQFVKKKNTNILHLIWHVLKNYCKINDYDNSLFYSNNTLKILSTVIIIIINRFLIFSVHKIKFLTFAHIRVKKKKKYTLKIFVFNHKYPPYLVLLNEIKLFLFLSHKIIRVQLVLCCFGVLKNRAIFW